MFRNAFIIIIIVLLVTPSFGSILPSDYNTDGHFLIFSNGLNKNFIFYDNLNSSILPHDSNILSAINNYFNSYQYFNNGFINNNWLSKTQCFLSKSNKNNISANFDFGALNDPKSLVYNHLTDNTGLNYDPILFPQILRNNLYMHSNLTYYLYNQTNHLVDSYSVTVLVDPNGYSIPLSIYSNAKIENNFAPIFGYGNYFVNYTITPTEVKCDFNGNSIIDFSETSLVFNSSFQSFTIIQPILDLDNDRYDDGVCKLAYPNCSNLTQVNTTFRDYVNPSKIDSCPNISGVGLNNGCIENYTSLSCNGMASFSNGVLCQNNADYINYDPFNVSQSVFSSQIPNKGSGNYSCYTFPSFVDNLFSFFTAKDVLVGSCTLRNNQQEFCSGGPNGDIIAKGSSKKYYKYKVILPSELADFQGLSCDNSKTLILDKTLGGKNSNLNTFNNIYNYSSPYVLDQSYSHIRRNLNGDLEFDGDNDQRGKISCSPYSDICKINLHGISQTINLSELSNGTFGRTIKVYKNGIFDRVKTLDPKLIALNSHKIKKFKSKKGVIAYLNKSIMISKKFDIVKNLTYNSTTNITTVKISLDNYAGGTISNFTLFQLISKSDASSVDNISFSPNSNAQRIVFDKDPIIGWYFNNSGSNNTVSYNLSGNTEGGNIIITQDPILLNDGEIVINYRENSCSQGETQIFDLADIENSVIKPINTGFYKVCISHLNSSINIALGNSNPNFLNIASFENNSNISSNFGDFTEKLSLSTTSQNVVWNMIIGENNPAGTYSCLGSFQILGGSSLFGDCGYNPLNRIWLHLGADNIPPTTNFSYPYQSHTIIVSLNATDNLGGSGVSETFYCIKNSTVICNSKLDFQIYNPLAKIRLTCPNDWSCSKSLYFFSTDNDGNNETITVNDFFLLEKGSSCQADCTSSPSPNRYVKECRNLNNCEYLGLQSENSNDKGKLIASKCNLLTRNSWVSFNSTHQVKCPIGPFRSNKFVTVPITFFSNLCEQIIKIQKPVIFDGELVTMDIISCYNPPNTYT